MKKELPEFHVEICHPENKYIITPIRDHIKTLEGVNAGFPYGHTSGEWGYSGKSWTAQKGTPIGFDLIYFSDYENRYYQINQDFDKNYVLDLASRCYAWQDESSSTYLKPFISRNDYDNNVLFYEQYYKPFENLVFGFAPQGMIVVWFKYGTVSIEIGRYQAKEITDSEKIKNAREMMFKIFRIDMETHEEMIGVAHLDTPKSQLWDNYRLKYNWTYKVKNENKNFRFLGVDLEYYNAEYEKHFAPRIQNEPTNPRAVPKVIHLFWETGKNERYISRIFFDWDKTNEWLKTSGVQDNIFNVKIEEDNSQLSIDLNGKPIEVDSIRIFPNSHMRFKDSYPE